MTDRIDHAAEARNYIACWEEKAGQHPELDMALLQVHATLALVEQQRIQNLIALARTGRATPHPLFVDEPDPWDYDARGTLRPDIAAALLIQEL